MAAETSTQYVAYTLYKTDPAWLRLPFEERAAGKEAFAEVVSSWPQFRHTRGVGAKAARTSSRARVLAFDHTSPVSPGEPLASMR